MTKTKKLRLRSAAKKLRADKKRELEDMLDRWHNREPNPRAYMTESGWLRWY